MSEWGEIARQENAVFKRRTLEEIKSSKNHIHQWLLQIPNKKHKALLEVGCGMGIYLMDDETMGFTGIGVELDSEAVKIARTHNLNVIEGDMKNMPFEDEKFDIVTAHGSIEHFPETEEALKEINRVMKYGGALLLNVPYKYSFFVISKKIQQVLGIWKCGYEKSFGRKELISILSNNGFKVLEVDKSPIEIGKNHPLLTTCLYYLDRLTAIFGLGGHHIWMKCEKK